MSNLPNSYEEWKYCITVKCGIPLTENFVAQRLADLSNINSLGTHKFIETWGSAHHRKTVAWFQQAANELKSRK